MRKLELLERLKGFHVYMAETGLDQHGVVKLEENHLDEFLRFCDEAGKKEVFCRIVLTEKQDYFIDEEEFLEDARERMDELMIGSMDFWKSVMIASREIQEDGLKKIRQYNESMEKTAKQVDETEIYMADIYTTHNGVLVGVQISPPDQELDNIIMEQENLIQQIFDELTARVQTMEEDRIKTREEDIRRKEEKKEKVLKEIRERIEAEEDLLKFKNKTKRHAFARSLTEEYKKKEEVNLSIVEVESIVEEVHDQRS